ncbi:hypothetical protein HK104_008208 [Borealophlyctis nickersoniae]|nr:hypothetical protein HK104_008208 [Borealophlyctis nickersoniae]
MPFEKLPEHAPEPDASQPLKDVANNIFTEYLSLTQQLFQSFQAVAENKPPLGGAPPTILARLLALDGELHRLVSRLEQHQKFQNKIDSISRTIGEHNAAILLLLRRLQNAESDLEKLLLTARNNLESMQRANKGPFRIAETGAVDFSEFIAYAQRVTLYTSGAFNPETRRVTKPVPDESAMRASLLFDPSAVAPDGTPEQAGQQQGQGSALLDIGMDLGQAVRPDGAPLEVEPEFDLNLDDFD